MANEDKGNDETCNDNTTSKKIASEEPQMTATVQRISTRRLNSWLSSDSQLFNGDETLNHRSTMDSVLIDATLVEVAEAESIGFCERHVKSIAAFLFVILVTSATALALTYERWRIPVPTLMPSTMPSMAPSFDPRPTLATVQLRGKLRCGHFASHTVGSFLYELCQAVAAVVLNDQYKAEKIDVTSSDRFIMLNERNVDLLAAGDTWTVERAVNEVTTNSPFTFSTPFYYDGIIYSGNATFVSCAENHKRYDECSQLVICVMNGTTFLEYVTNYFEAKFVKVTANLSESLLLYSNDTCNVVVDHRLSFLNLKYREHNIIVNEPTFAIGNKTFGNDPLSFVTRSDDQEWSKIVNWVLQTLISGERQGITKNETLCQSNTSAINATWSELYFPNAVYCVGNYAEIYDKSHFAEDARTAKNHINHGTPMHHLIPYGNLQNTNDQRLFANLSRTFAEINNRGTIKCGLLTQNGYSENDTTNSSDLFGLGVDFCRTLASSMLHGNLNGVTYTTFQDEDESLAALNDEEIDVLLGVAAEMSINFGTNNLAGVVFSTPYYYGNHDAIETDVYPIMTREEDLFFSSFVNCIILSTFYAVYHDIDKNKSYEMPEMTIFGSDMVWALKDSLSGIGNYDEIYFNNFDVVDENRGRNALNLRQEPQLLDIPGVVF